MSWAKFDDGYDDNPKCRAAGKDGRALDQAAIRYCAKNLTNGVIPDHDLPVLAAKADVRQRPTVRRLVEEGRWHEPGHDCERCAERVDCPPGHHLVHDYLDYNPTGEKERAKRQARAEAGRKGGQRSRPPGTTGEAKPEAIASANGQANAEQKRNPVSRIPPEEFSDHSRLPTGPPDDDDQDQTIPDQGEHQDSLDRLVGQALAILVDRDLDARQQNALLTPIGDIESWKRKAAWTRTERGTLAALVEFARLDPQAGPEQLADALEPPHNGTSAATSEPPRAPLPVHVAPLGSDPERTWTGPPSDLMQTWSHLPRRNQGAST